MALILVVNAFVLLEDSRSFVPVDVAHVSPRAERSVFGDALAARGQGICTVQPNLVSACCYCMLHLKLSLPLVSPNDIGKTRVFGRFDRGWLAVKTYMTTEA